MAVPVHTLATYLHLARASEIRQRRHVRDRLLVLSAVVATVAELPRIAAYCRRKILEHNPQHMLRRYMTVEEAMQNEEFLSLVKQLQTRYSVEKSEQLLSNLGIELQNEHAAYYTDEEYAASLLGTTPEKLGKLFDDDLSG